MDRQSLLNGNQLFSCLLIALAVCLAMPSTCNASQATSMIEIKDNQGAFLLGSLRVVPADSQYMAPTIWPLIDSLAADSIVKVYPGFNPADTSFVRPDGKTRKLKDLSRFYMVHFPGPVDIPAFKIAYESIMTKSLANLVYIGVEDFTPLDLNPLNQPYLLSPDSSIGNSINAVTAWDFTVGDTTQLISIIERGIDSTHFELAGRMAGGATFDGTSPFNGLDHGTAVASVLMASQNDSGMVGINWDTRLFVIRRDFSTTNWGKAMDTSYLAGATLSNISIGAVRSGNMCSNTEGSLASSASNVWVKDHIVVASKGNVNDKAFHVPSDLPTVLGVGSVDVNGLKYIYNFGQGIKLSAPGQNVYRAVAGGGFVKNNGTSLSAPLVTGALSLVSAANPNLLADELSNCFTRPRPT